jgi:hypothetical protein
MPTLSHIPHTLFMVFKTVYTVWLKMLLKDIGKNRSLNVLWTVCNRKLVLTRSDHGQTYLYQQAMLFTDEEQVKYMDFIITQTHVLSNVNKKFWEELITYFPSIWHRLHRNEKIGGGGRVGIWRCTDTWIARSSQSVHRHTYREMTSLK